MPVAVPQTIRKAWGDEVVAEFVPWLDETLEQALREKAVARDEYRQVLSRLDLLDQGLSLINDQLVQTRSEFSEGQAGMRAEFRGELARTRAEFRQELAQTRAEFRQDLGELRRDMDERFDKIHERFDGMYDRMLVQSRWLVGSIALFGTVISILLAIGQFVK